MSARPSTSGPGARLDGAVGLGLILITIGVVLTLDNLDIVSAGDLVAGWWPVAVAVVGFWVGLRGNLVVGTLLVVVGGVLLLATRDVVTSSAGELVAPGILVVLGGAMLQAGRRVAAARARWAAALEEAVRTGRRGSPVLSPTATAVLGDAVLVLDDDVPAGGRLVVSTTSVLGDVRVEVPAGWAIEDRITRVLGDVEVPTRTHPASVGVPTVELHGVALLGDVDVVERAGTGGAR